jgi:ATP-dependent exoDNAse (exonuclease V) beta subunit
LLNDLYGLCRGGEAKTETVWQALGDATRVASLTPDGQQRIGRVTSILERGLALRGRIGLRDCVERTWLALGGPATIGNGGALRDAEAYFERLEQIERNGDIEDIARLEEVLRDLYAAPSNSVQTNVELMTIHRAKGLEFDVVILPALDCGARGEDHPILRAQELPWLGEHALLLAPIAARGADADAIYQWLSRLDKERARFEKGRLLYVAATRAERELHLFGALQSGSKPRANTFLHLLWPAVEADFAAQTEESSTQPNSAVAPAGIQTRRLPLDWRPPPPKAAARSGRFDVVEDEPLHPEFEWAGETSRHVGTLAHREIERIARAGLDTFAPTSLGSLGTRFSIELAELGVPPHLRDNAVSRVIDVLTNIVHDERGRWLLDPRHCDAASELALSAIDGGELINGVIDRTFVDASGTRWIVDFKTSAHEGGGLEEFLSRETERYRPQLQRYARLMRGFRPQEPIKAALYFPLLKAWREVPL